MEAAFVTSSVSRDAGGLFFAMKSMAKNLHHAGVNLRVHGVQDGHSSQDERAWDPVPCIAHARRGPAALAWSPDLGKELIDGNSELLHRHGMWQAPSSAVHRWHQATRKPYIISPHGMLDPWALAQSGWKKLIVSALYETAHLRDAACIHTLCQSEADSIRAYGLKNPVCIIPNGIELPVEKQETRDQRPEKKVLLFLGRLHPKKGLPNALRAWKQALHSKSNDWQLVVAGWDQGGHEAELKRLCDEIGLAYSAVSASAFADNRQSNDSDASVIFVGPAFGETKEALLRHASAFILPSFSEGLPMSVLEAWSYRLPVLMTDECNLPEGFAADAAFRIETDTVSIARCIDAIQQAQAQDLKSMGDRGYALVKEHFAWDQIARTMKDVYNWVLGGGDAPACIRK